ncbi:MAG TPA: Spy/CpxP family protein refolding chaperone [Stellaceae bacterium]|nr:Spy/CpxP family protein refolding chaperone [Stellaceae bacterium]
MARRIDRATRVALALATGLAAASAAVPASAAGGASPRVQLVQAAPPAGDQFAALRQQLAITPAQEPKFDAFVQVMRDNDAARAAFLRGNPPDRRRNALAELRVQSEAADLDARGLRRLVPAFEALYASLSSQQKQTADRVFAAPAR